jgi:O-antigen/teichoic acid export membrane protein
VKGLASNVGARATALVALGLATLLVARTGGAAAVGVYALLRVVPGLAGVLASLGLPGAIAYFLAGPRRDDPRLPLTLVAMALAGGVAGTLVWTAAAPLLRDVLFQALSLALVIWAGVTILTQLLLTTAKSCSQGRDDLRGANWVIVNEELPFLPLYGLLWVAGVDGYAAVVFGLLLADVVALVPAWARVLRRGYLRGAGRPSATLAREVASYGIRAQIGGVITLMNLRLDFIVLQLMAGPAVLGVYAIASKYAELLKVPSLALTYVLYPRFARDGAEAAARGARGLLSRAGMLTTGVAVPLFACAGAVIPALYGSEFVGAVIPAQIILVGLAADGAGAVVTAFLYGTARPGLNSWAMTAGLVVTVVLDVLLIPRLGATGAAIASATAYLASTAALGAFFWWIDRSGHGRPAWEAR